jgi:repressor LexA
MMAKRKRLPPGVNLTPRQMQVLKMIRDSVRSLGYSPTLQEMADEAGVTKVTVFEHVETLIDKGLLRRSAHKARSLEITSKAVFPDDRPTVLSIEGRIAAGAPIESFDDPRSLDLEEIFCGKAPRFVLEVSGDSMIDDHINDGDYVVVEKRTNVRNGDTVVAVMPDGEATLKRFFKEKNRFRLQPANAKYKPIYVKEIDLQGVVVGLVRRC